MPVFTQDDLGGQHQLLIQHHQSLARQRRRPRSAQFFKAMFTGREMIPIENFRAVSWHQRRQLRLQLTNHRGGLPCRVTDQFSRYAQFNMIQFIIDGLVRDTKLVRLRLIGGMHAGLDTKHDLAHQVYHRRKQQRPRILHFGGACKQRIDPLGIEQMLQHATGHHTDRSLFNKRFEDFPQRYRHLCPSFIGSLLLAGGTKLPNIAAPWKG